MLSVEKKFLEEAEISRGSVKLNHSCFGNCLYEFPLNMWKQDKIDKHYQKCNTSHTFICYFPCLKFNNNREKKMSFTQRHGRCCHVKSFLGRLQPNYMAKTQL